MYTLLRDNESDRMSKGVYDGYSRENCAAHRSLRRHWPRYCSVTLLSGGKSGSGGSVSGKTSMEEQKKIMASVWYEVFLVMREGDQVISLRQQHEPLPGAWLISHQIGVHPNDTVVENLAAFFGEVFESGKSIVHSTSWRYEGRSDRLLLTYLAVLPSGAWVHQWAASGRISLRPIATMKTVCGDHISPPKLIERDHVLAHALDHLAALSTYDQAIQNVLEPGWFPLLRCRHPKSAGYLALSF